MYRWMDKLARVIPGAGIAILLLVSVVGAWAFGIRGFALGIAMVALFGVWCSVMTGLIRLVRRGEIEQ